MGGGMDQAKPQVAYSGTEKLELVAGSFFVTSVALRRTTVPLAILITTNNIPTIKII